MGDPSQIVANRMGRKMIPVRKRAIIYTEQ
jgi:hypothetical protein